MLEMNREHKIVKLSILVLCFALIFVYMIWFYVKWDQLSVNTNEQYYVNAEESVNNTSNNVEDINSNDTNKTKILSVNTASDIPHNKWIDSISWSTSNTNISNAIEVVDTNTVNDDTISTIENSNLEFTPSTVNEKRILSGTMLLDKAGEIIDKLWIKYRYVLKDSKNIEYLYLWNGINNDFVEIAKQHWWSIYTLDTEYEIKKNELFGERIIYLNLPNYNKKNVLMIVKYDDQYWLLNIDYTIYHKSKGYLKDLFTD